ncbi:MAG: acetate kinase [marine bacterium B5-7]|nr:MAG: acetate kinase [marine bacterium B5-7]
MSEPLLLVINAGSSSLKFATFNAKTLMRLFAGGAEMRSSGIRFTIENEHDVCVRSEIIESTDWRRQTVEKLFAWLEDEKLTSLIKAIGHRVVHGGGILCKPCRIDGPVLDTLEQAVPLAPLHLPENLKAIRTAIRIMPELTQVACFDTAFHACQSRVTRTYALPAELYKPGYERYGFHGLSYEYITSRLNDLFSPHTAEGRVIVAHLGNGASLCGMREGQSVATTLGYSTLDGLIMGTRPGNLDPALVLQLVRDHNGDIDHVERLLYQRAGLLGVSGISHDMRVLLESNAEGAKLAVELFVNRAQRELGSIAVAIGGIDGLVFTGGMGAHSTTIRERIASGLEWLGISLDPDRNFAGNVRIESSQSKVAIAAIETDEEIVIARHTRSIIDGV